MSMFCCEIGIAKCLINYRYLLMPITMYKLKVTTSFKSLYLTLSPLKRRPRGRDRPRGPQTPLFSLKIVLFQAFKCPSPFWNIWICPCTPCQLKPNTKPLRRVTNNCPNAFPHHFSSLRFTMQMVVISPETSFQRPIEITERITL